MFGGGRDPFDPFGTHRQMEQMMDSMMQDSFGMFDNFFNGFGNPRMNRMGMLENSGIRDASSRRTNRNNQQLASPFGFGGGIFGNMMQQMQMMENHSINDPNAHVFSQSTMISYDGSGAPKVVQKSVRKTGDVKETRKTVRDGEREEVTVGHAIGDREHIIEKKRDRDGKVRKNQKFVNLDEDEAEHFNNEFKTRAQRNLQGLFGDEYASNSHHQAIENGSRSSRHHVAADEMEHSGRSSSRHHQHSSSSSKKKESQPIIEIPDDDEGDELPANDRRHRVTYSNNRSSGPRIEEVDEDGTSSKRRKGLFGRYFANDD